MATRTVKKELKIFRGTYAEVVQQITEDMTIYFAWDTQEIFVGNKYGVKTPYIGGNRLSEREIRDLFTELTDSELTLLRSQVSTYWQKALDNENAISVLNVRINVLEGNNNDEIVAAVVAILTGSGGVLENYYTKSQISNEINTSLLNYYTKTETDNIFPTTVGPFKNDYDNLKSTVFSLESGLADYSGVRLLSESILSPLALLTNLSNASHGIYRAETEILLEDESTEITVNELFIKNDTDVIRFTYDGYVKKLNDSNWEHMELYNETEFIKSINNITTLNNSINLDQDDIDETETRKFNNLLPQTDNAVNPQGRGAGTIGVGSVAIGKDSIAGGVNSTAIGLNAVTNGDNSIQLGYDTTLTGKENKLYAWNHEVLDKTTGKIPNERIIERFFELPNIQIDSGDWDLFAKTVTVEVLGMTDSAIVWVSPAESTLANYANANVRAISQSTDTLIFKADQIPTSNLFVNIVWRD